MEFEAIAQVQEALRPKFLAVIEHLQAQDEAMAASFFTNLVIKLNMATEEEHLLEMSIELSSAAFLGFNYDGRGAMLVDDLLAEAEAIALTFTADPAQPQ